MAAPRELVLSDEVEGEQDGTTDFVFRLVGDPIPVLPIPSSPLPLFDLQSPPARPLAVSNRHAAVFLAHPNGKLCPRDSPTNQPSARRSIPSADLTP
jgi:nuclear pore complex protein Nup214